MKDIKTNIEHLKDEHRTSNIELRMEEAEKKQTDFQEATEVVFQL